MSCKTFQTNKAKGLLIEIPQATSDFFISAEFRPYCVWLEATGLEFPMPIGNMIYPYRHDQLEIVGTSNEVNKNDYSIPEQGRWLVIKIKEVNP